MNNIIRCRIINILLSAFGFHPTLVTLYLQLPSWFQRRLLLKRFLYKVPFQYGRTSRGSSFSHNTEDCFFPFFNQIIRSVQDTDLGTSHINRFNSSVSAELTMSSGTYFRRHGCQYNSVFPLWSQVWPWQQFTEQQKLITYTKDLQLNRQAFLDPNSLHSFNLLSPVLSTSFDISTFTDTHVNQFTQLYESYVSGRLPRSTLFHASPITAYFLVTGSSWRWLMDTEGNHRAYLYYLMNHSFVHVRLSDVVRRSNVDSWINVKNGLYTREEALKVFDLVFSGQHVLQGLI